MLQADEIARLEQAASALLKNWVSPEPGINNYELLLPSVDLDDSARYSGSGEETWLG